MRKYLPAAVAAFFISALAACGGSADKAVEETENGEAARASVEAAMMEGRTAARAFLSQDVADTMAMQQKLLDARAMQSKYITSGHKEAAQAFDTAFVHTLRAARPELASAIEESYSK